jgi:hypothetical protein
MVLVGRGPRSATPRGWQRASSTFLIHRALARSEGVAFLQPTEGVAPAALGVGRDARHDVVVLAHRSYGSACSPNFVTVGSTP